MRYLAAFFVVLICCIPCHAEEPASPLQILQWTTLTKEVVIQNSANVYLNIESLKKQPDSLINEAKDLSLVQLNIAWLKNPSGDSRTKEIMLDKGISLYQVIGKIAAVRGEIVDYHPNFVVIRPAGEGKHLGSYLQAKSDTKGELATRWIGALIPPGITNLQNVDGSMLEDFINFKFKESQSYDKGSSPSTLRLKVNPTAKDEVQNVSVTGCWFYGNLMDAYCELLDLRWRVDGNTLWLEKPPQDSKN